MSEVLPAHLHWLKNRAKEKLERLRAEKPAAKLADAQLALVREYGFASWRKLKEQVDLLKSKAITNDRDQPPTMIGTSTSHTPDSSFPFQETFPMTSSSTQATNLGLSAIDQVSLSCTDLDAAQQFYCGVLGLPFAGDAPPHMKFFDCAGVNIIMTKGDKVSPSSIIYFKVEGVPDLMQSKVDMLKAAGVKVEQDARCIAKNWHGFDVWLAFFRDPFGNMLAFKSDVPVK